MKLKRIISLFLFLSSLWFVNDVNAQVPRYIRNLINIDSIAQSMDMPVFVLKEVYIFPTQSRHDSKYIKLVRNFIKVYPYALLIKEEMAEIEKHLETLPDERSRRRFVNKKDKELKAQYQKILMKFTLS